MVFGLNLFKKSGTSGRPVRTKEQEEYWNRRHEFDNNIALATDNLVVVTSDKIIPIEEYKGNTHEVKAKSFCEDNILYYTPEGMNELLKTLYKYDFKEYEYVAGLTKKIFEVTEAKRIQNRYYLNDGRMTRKHWGIDDLFILPEKFPSVVVYFNFSYMGNFKDNIEWSINSKATVSENSVGLIGRFIKYKPNLENLTNELKEAEKEDMYYYMTTLG